MYPEKVNQCVKHQALKKLSFVSLNISSGELTTRNGIQQILYKLFLINSFHYFRIYPDHLLKINFDSPAKSKNKIKVEKIDTCKKNFSFCSLFTIYVYTSWTSVFNGLTSQEIFLPSSGNVNDYVPHISRKYGDLDGNNKN